MNRIFIWVTLLCPFLIVAQETTGSLEGKITDKEGAPIALATIIVTDTETNFKFGAISQESGYYSITNIPPTSTYKVNVSFIGYQSIVINNVQVNLSDHLSRFCFGRNE